MAVERSRMARRFGLGLVAAGALALGGCAVVPVGPYYDVGAPVAVPATAYYGGAPYAYSAPYGYAYSAPYARPYVGPSISLGFWGGFGGGGHRHGHGHRGGGFRR